MNQSLRSLNYFSQVIDSLDLCEFSSEPHRVHADEIGNIVSKLKTHPCIVKIKKHFKIKTTFSFSSTSIINNNKAVSAENPLHI